MRAAPSTDAIHTTGPATLQGVFGRPFVALDDLFDLSELPAIHDEVCLALAQMPTSYTGGSHRSMGIMPAGREAEALVDYQEVIRGLDEAGFATFRGLADDPGALPATLEARDEVEFGEERDVPLSARQMLWLKMRHGVYFPWKVYAELIPNRRWEDKCDPAGKRFTRRAEALLPRTIAFAKRLPLQHIGRCNIMGLEAHDHGTAHRDGVPTPGRAPCPFLTISPRGDKRLYVLDERTGARTVVEGRVVWFNDHDYHGVLADPVFRYSIRVDGPFTPEFEATLARRFGEGAVSGAQGPAFEKDVGVDKAGIVGARWWHKALMAEADAKADLGRRNCLIALGALVGGVCLLRGAGAAVGGALEALASESTSVATRPAIDMQRLYGWDFGARGVPLVFDGVAQGPFERAQLDGLAAALTPAASGPNKKHHVATLVVSLSATPTVTLPDPQDGQPRPDAAPFKRLSEVLVPIVTPAMTRAYQVGEAVARLVGARSGFALLVDLPGPEAVAFAAGACARFEPVLLLDNWPHPHGVVPSHLALAALAYYQPRFAAQQAARGSSGPVFVLDRARLNAYSEQGDRFDNRYHARLPRLEALATEGVRSLLYVVADAAALPEPADLSEPLAAGAALPRFEARAIALTDFAADPTDRERFVYSSGASRTDQAFHDDYPFGSRASPEAPPLGSKATKDHRFAAHAAGAHTPPADWGTVPVIVTTSGLILAAALDRQGSRNRFAGGWGG